MTVDVGVIGATGFIGTPCPMEIRECSEAAKIVALCGWGQDRLKAAAAEHLTVYLRWEFNGLSKL